MRDASRVDLTRLSAPTVLGSNGLPTAPLPPSPRDAVPHYHGHRERLRARLRDAGADALADYELLEMVLFGANSRSDTKALAKKLIGKFGSFANVVSAPRERLNELDGVGEGAIAALKVVEAAASR